MDSGALFQVSTTVQGASPDILGLWQVQALDRSPVQLAPEGAEIGSIWWVKLPDDPGEAGRALQSQELRIRGIRATLPAVVRQLEADLRSLPEPGAGATFSTTTSWPSYAPGTPRSVLQQAAQNQWPEASYGLLDRFKLEIPQLEEAARMVSAFTEQVRRTVEQFALVETSSGDRRLGSTRIAWSGDVETWWASGLGPEHYPQHTRVLAQVLATRQEWLRALLVISTGAVKVAAALATGPFSPLTIWTIWNYLKSTTSAVSNALGGNPDTENL